MAKVDLYTFSDLLTHANKLGYNWNDAHEILVDDEVPPMYENKKRTIYLSEIIHRGWSEESIEIVKTFMEKENIKTMILIND